MGIITFVLVIGCFAVLTAVNFALTDKRANKPEKRIRKASRIAVIVCAAVLAVILLLDVFGASGLSGYRFVSVWGELLAFISLAAFNDKVSEKRRPLFRSIIRALTVSLVIELFVFNINSAHLLKGGYTEKELSFSEAELVNFSAATGQNIEQGGASLEFRGIEMPVGTLTVCGESTSNTSVSFSVDMSDDTYSAAYRNGIASLNVIKGYPRSTTIPCNFSGTVHDLRISFSAADGETITIKSIVVNSPISLHFSLLRFLLMLLGALAVFFLSSERYLARSMEERRKPFYACAWTITALLVGVSLFLTNMSRYTDAGHSLSNDFRMTYGNQISQEIVDAFEDGRIYLDTPMNEQLAALDNPYDDSQRRDIGGYPWDHLLFDGKYYSYYGIGPVLVLFWPYHAITGYYFPSSWAIWLFGVIGIICLTKMFIVLCEKFFRRTYASLLLLGLLIMQLSTGIWFCYSVANFYEIAQASGFTCVTAGAWLLVSSNVIGRGKLSNARLALSTVCLSLGVLCRPTLAVYCIAALLFIYAGFKKKKAEYKTGSKVKFYAPYFLCALLPFVVIGSIQVWYNWARFGNPLDFGIQYSLTINDFTSAEYHSHFAAIGFFNYLLAFPAFTQNFPFFRADWANTFDPQGYYFVATGAALGLLWRALPIAAYSKSVRAYRLAEAPEKRLYTILMIAVCIACPFAVIFSIWESGYGTRYCVDFAWQLIIGALIICYVVHGKANKAVKKHLNSLMIFAAGLSIVMNFIQVWSYDNPTAAFAPEWQAKAMELTRIFEFWR